MIGMSTIHDPRYIQLIKELVSARSQRNITQVMLAHRLGQHQSYVAKIEGLERRLDIIELFDWLQGLDYEPQKFFQDIEQPSDKRKYIEEHGSFDACFSYNLRTIASNKSTPSGKHIFVCSLKPAEDVFPSKIVATWEKYKNNL